MQKLNYQTMKDNILKELDDPQEKRCDINITINDYFERHQATKKIRLTTRVKKYGLVLDKRVIDRSSRVPNRTVTAGTAMRWPCYCLCNRIL